MKKQRKANASLRKKKRQRAKNKRLREKGIIVPENSSTEDVQAQEKPDSLKYKFKAQQEERYIIVSFSKSNPDKTDSVYVRYNAYEDDVLEYDKQLLKNYIDSNGVDKIQVINVREHIGDAEEDKKHNKHASTVKEHVAQYFVKLGITRERIKTLSRN